MKVFFMCFTVSALLMESCHSTDESKDEYVVKFTKQVAPDQVDAALKLKSKATTLDLGGQKWVNDGFISELSQKEMAKKLINLDLSGTSVTSEGLKHILFSSLGSLRDMLATNERHNCPASEVHLDVRNTAVAKEVEAYKNPVVSQLFENLSKRNVQGIKSLRFTK